MSSGNLDRYQYLTAKDQNYKPSNVEQAKFDYFPLSKFFINNLKKEDKKERLLKRLKTIEEQSAFSTANRVSKATKNETNYNYEYNFAFCRFYRDKQRFKRTSVPSKYDEINDFHTLLDAL